MESGEDIQLLSRDQKRVLRSVLLSIFLLGAGPAILKSVAAPDGSGSKPKSAANLQPTGNIAPSQRTDWQKSTQAGRSALKAGNLAEAEVKLQAASATAEKLKDKQLMIESLNLLADCHDKLQNYEQEQVDRRLALKLARETSGETGPQTAEQMALLGSLLAKQGAVGEARTLLDQAMELVGKLGQAHPLEQAWCYLALGRTQIAEGVPGLADDSFKKALELREAKLGAKNELVLDTMSEYATLLEQLDRKDEAKKLQEKVTLAHATAAATAGSTGASTAAPGASLFKKYIATARDAEAKGDRQTAIANWKLALSETEKSTAKDGRAAFVLVHLADQYLYNKETAEAQALYKRGIEMREQASATDTLGMARNLLRLATLYTGKSDYAESNRLLSRALAIEDRCGASDLLLSNTLQYLCSGCVAGKDFAQAEAACKRLISVAGSMQSPTAVMKKNMGTGMLVSIYMQTGRMAEGASMAKDLSGAFAQAKSNDLTAAYQADYNAVEKQVDESEEKVFR